MQISLFEIDSILVLNVTLQFDMLYRALDKRDHS